MKTSNWFEVSQQGLKQLQSGKPKHYLVRELIQNAWDEDISICKVDIKYIKDHAIITVEDDSPHGFRDLSESYTLYAKSYKQSDPSKRGRFNLGEKQSFAVCDSAIIKTTTGTVSFTEKGRGFDSNNRTKKGTIVEVKVPMTQRECGEILENVMHYHVPEHIKYIVNGVTVSPSQVFKEFEAALLTEQLDKDVFKRTTRKALVRLFKESPARLYELGIPVTEIECAYSVDVQQKVPLNTDRDTVSQQFLRDVFAEVLNNTIDVIETGELSEAWVNTGIGDERTSSEVLSQVVKARYGENVAIANNFDPNSVDEAISRGFTPLRGREFASEVFGRLKELVPTTTSLFGMSITTVPSLAPTLNQERVASLAVAIARELLNIDIKVRFIELPAGVAAQFSVEGRALTFNITKLGNKFFECPLSEQVLDLIIHELGHWQGNHTESGYHELLTQLGAKLTLLAIDRPEFFEKWRNL